MQLFKDTHLTKLELLSNATTIDSALQDESNEPDYNEDKDQLEEEQEQETKTELTTNQVF